MTLSGPHALYVWSAYGATALAIGALVIRAVLDHRAQARALARLGGAEPLGRAEHDRAPRG